MIRAFPMRDPRSWRASDGLESEPAKVIAASRSNLRLAKSALFPNMAASYTPALRASRDFDPLHDATSSYEKGPAASTLATSDCNQGVTGMIRAEAELAAIRGLLAHGNSTH